MRVTEGVQQRPSVQVPQVRGRNRRAVEQPAKVNLTAWWGRTVRWHFLPWKTDKLTKYTHFHHITSIEAILFTLYHHDGTVKSCCVNLFKVPPVLSETESPHLWLQACLEINEHIFSISLMLFTVLALMDTYIHLGCYYLFRLMTGSHWKILHLDVCGTHEAPAASNICLLLCILTAAHLIRCICLLETFLSVFINMNPCVCSESATNL